MCIEMLFEIGKLLFDFILTIFIKMNIKPDNRSGSITSGLTGHAQDNQIMQVPWDKNSRSVLYPLTVQQCEDINNAENLLTANSVDNTTKGHKVLDNKCFAHLIITEFANKAPSKESSATQSSLATKTQHQGGPDTQGNPAVNCSVSDDDGDDVPSGEDRNATPTDADIDASPCGQDHVEPSPLKCDSSDHPQNSTSGEPPTNVESEKMTMDAAVGEGESNSGASTATNSYQIPNKSNSGPAQPPTPSDSNNTSDSIQLEESLASKPDETPVGESEPNSTITEVAAIAESNKNPVDEKEPEFDCNKPNGQGETEESMQADECDIVCGQGEVHPTTTSTPTASISSGFDNSPTYTKSDVATTSVSAENDEDRACVDDSATALNAEKATVAPTESTTAPSQPSGGTFEAILCDTPCVNAPLDPASEGYTPEECHSELADSCSLAVQDILAVADSVISSDSFTAIPPTDIKPDDDHQAAKIVDSHNGSESSAYGCPAEEAMLASVELAYQSDKQDTTLQSRKSSIVDSPAITETDRKLDDNSSRIDFPKNMVPNVISSEMTTEVSTYCEADCLSFAQHKDIKASSSDVVPSSGNYKASCVETFSKRTVDVPLLACIWTLIIMQLIQPVFTQAEATNTTSSNVTEINLMTEGNGNKSFPVTGQVNTLAVYWIIAIGIAMEFMGVIYLFAHRQQIFTSWYMVFLGMVVRACKCACWYVWHVIQMYIEYHGGQQEPLLPLTSAMDVQTSTTNSAKCLVPPSNENTPPQVIDQSLSSFEALSCDWVSESVTSNNEHLQQSIESGYHSMAPAPLSPVALPSGKDGRVHKPLRPRFDQQSTDVSSQTTELLEQGSSPTPSDNNQRMDHSDTKVECAEAENCNQGEFVSIGFHRKKPHMAVSSGEVQQEETQPGEGRSEFAGPTQCCRERNIQQLPPQVITVPPEANVELSPVQTVALPIDPTVQILAFNAAVDEAERESLDPPEDVPNCTPITLENSFFNPEQGLRLNVGLADAEVHMYQLQALPFTPPHAAIDDAADSAPVYPPLPGIPPANAELQPVFPPLPAMPSTSTPMVVIPATYGL